MRGSQPVAPTDSEDPSSSAATPNQHAAPGQGQAQSQPPAPPVETPAPNADTSSAELTVAQTSSATSSAPFANLNGSIDVCNNV